MLRKYPIIVDNAKLIGSLNNMFIGASFAPIFAIKIDTCWLVINENADALLKDFAYLQLYFRAAKYTVKNIFVDWIFK